MHTLSSAHNSFEAWNQALRQVCGRFESQPALNRTLFIGDISRQDLGGLEFPTDSSNTPRSISPAKRYAGTCHPASGPSANSRRTAPVVAC